MALPVANLDDRTFQDLVNEARSRIPFYCPEWTDHNLSDPGITLIELFAWMTELIIYRLNRVPDKNYVKFLELLGVTLAPGNPATTDVTFMLTAPQSSAVTIPRGTEVATVRTETQSAVTFATDEDVKIAPAELEWLLISRDGSRFDDRMPVLREWAAQGNMLTQGDEPRSFTLFQDVPEPGNAFYLGFTSDLRRAALSIYLECEELEAPGVNPTDPPLLWEYWDGVAQGWVVFGRALETEAVLEVDDTRGLNTPGRILLHLPETVAVTSVALREGYWLRCTVTAWTEAQGSYEQSPRIKSAYSQSVGGTVSASNITPVFDEPLGISDGKPGQVMRISQTPILPLGTGETVEVEGEGDGGWEPWQQVADFSGSDQDSKHFVCDPVSGEVMFGPVIRSPSGQETRYGATPQLGRHMRLTSYRHGGGPRGNVGRDTLTVLKSSIPYVARVYNRKAATGGVDPESIENAKLRGPQVLKTRNRAVTEDDFEYLAREASPSVGRARCIQPRGMDTEEAPLPGVVQVLVVPALSTELARVTPEHLSVSRELLNQVRSYLDERRLLTTVLVVSEPDYVWASVDARVKVRQGADSRLVAQAVEDQLYRFLHPLTGGADRDGWPFGRSLFASELHSQIQAVDGVEYTEELRIFSVDPASQERGEAVQALAVPRSGLVCSHGHTITCS